MNLIWIHLHNLHEIKMGITIIFWYVQLLPIVMSLRCVSAPQESSMSFHISLMCTIHSVYALNIFQKWIDSVVQPLIPFLQQLDENVSLESLEKTVGYFASVYPTHLLSEKMDQTTYLCDTSRVLSSGADATTTCASTVLALLHVSLYGIYAFSTHSYNLEGPIVILNHATLHPTSCIM